MKTLVGIVRENTDDSEVGTLMVHFRDKFGDHPQPVTYTSPFFKINAGGIVAVPEVGDQVLVFWNEELTQGEKPFYYISTIVASKETPGNNIENPNFKPLRSTDSQAQVYNKQNKPVTQAFTNSVGAGVLIQRDMQDDRIKNSVTVKEEGGNEVTVSPLGIQMKNPQGDSIVLTGSNGDEQRPARSLDINTQLSQRYVCQDSSIVMKINEGMDINIANDSSGPNGPNGTNGKFYGNVRLKSKFKNIDLAAIGDKSHVNIITKGAFIQVNSEGSVKITGDGNIQLASRGSINMNASGGVNIFGGDPGVKIGSSGGVKLNGNSVSVNDTEIKFLPTSNSKDDLAAPVSQSPGTAPESINITDNDYTDPVGVPI